MTADADRARNTGFRITLRTRIVAALIAFALLPMLVVSVILAVEFGPMKEDARLRVAAAATALDDVIDRNLFERYGDVQAFGYNAAAHDPANWDKPGDGNPLVVAMNRYTANYGIYKLMLLVAPDGKVLAVNSKDAAGKPLDTAAIYKTSYAAAPWLKAALAGDFLKGRNGFTGTVVEQPARYPELGQLYGGDDYALVFAAPVTDATGKTIGVWANFAGMDLVEDIVTQADTTIRGRGLVGAELTVLDPKGNVIVDYDDARFNGQAYKRDFSVLGKLNLVEAGVAAAKLAVAGGTGAIDSLHARKKILQAAGYHHSTGAYDYPGLGWSVLVRVPAGQAYATVDRIILVLAITIAVTILLSLAVGLWFGGALAKPIRRVTSALTDMVEGKVEIDTTGRERRDEIGAALTAAAEIRDRIVLGLQAGGTLDSITSSVMLADADNTIIYINRSARELFEAAEADIRKELPHFDKGKLVGSKIDLFHKKPEHQQRMIAALDKPHAASISVGSRRFDLTAVPVFDSTGLRLGTAVEWRDMTQQHAVQAEVTGLVEAARAGDFSRRVALEGKSGFMRDIAAGINGMADTVAKAIGELDGVLGSLAQGDLSREMAGQYGGQIKALQQSTNATIAKLREITGSIGETAFNVNNASSEIAVGAQDLAQRTESQAATLEQTAAAMHEVTETVRQNADNANAANQRALVARDTAQKGGSVVSDAVGAMTEIEQSAQKIADIVGLIDEIAFQTNLLALNASVEAARAGEAGKGFAVVAQEVRALAQRSANASKDIKTLIAASNGYVRNGVQLVNQTGAALEEIVAAVKQVTDIVAEIAAASTEQARAMQEINTAVGQMDEMTQRNGALVEETSAATQNLAHQARQMSDLAGFFRMGDAGLAERRRETRFDAGPDDSVVYGGASVPLQNWSRQGLYIGPVATPPRVGDKSRIEVGVASAGLHFAAEATVVRIDGQFVALRFVADEAAQQKIAGHFG